MKRQTRARVLGALLCCAVYAPNAVRSEPQDAARQTRAEPVALEVGKPVERELKGGETHRYRIRLEAGQYLYVVVDQKGIDVAVTLVGPNDAKLAEVDSPSGPAGPEQVSWVAETGGTYRVEVGAPDASAAAGSYQVLAREVRAATDADREVVEAQSLAGQAEALSSDGKLDEAIPVAERAVALYEKALGPDRAEVAASLNNLALLFYAKRQYAKAEPLMVRALAIHEKLVGPTHALVAGDLYNLAEVYRAQGQSANAEPALVRAVAIFEKELGPEHPDLASSLNNLALVYRAQGQYAKAETLMVRVLAIGEKAFGPDHPEVATSLNNLGLLYRDQGQYSKAEPILMRALAIREKALGPDHPDVGGSLNNLAFVYSDQGQYAKAEPLLVRAVAIREKALGPEHPLVANLLNNLAELYRSQGQLAKAEPILVRALAIREKALRPEHPDVAASLNNLAELYRAQGQYAKAEPLFARALAIREKELGPEHPLVAASVNDVALLYLDQRQYAKAELLYVRALAIREKTLGSEHPDVAASLNNLGFLYSAQGQYAKAEPLYTRALAIREKALGPEHPEVALSLNSLAALYMAASDLDAAIRFRARAGVAREAELRHNLTAGSEQAKRLYLEQTRSETDLTLSIQAASPPSNTAALQIALTEVLRRKGRALDALVDQLDVLARSGSPEDRRLLDELARARREYAALTLRGPGREGNERHRQELGAASARVDELEGQASARSSRVRADLTPITLDGVRAAVPAGATLVEFATYRPFDAKARTFGATRYVVYTLAADGGIRWADLGEAAPIEAAVAALRDVLRARADGTLSRVDAEVKPRARALDALVFAPVRKLVGASTRLLIAPDGQLSLVPFDALVDERGRYATETYEISYLTSGRDLLRLAARGESRQPSAVLANPRFGEVRPGETRERLLVVEAKSQQTASTAELLARAYFPPLPGTAAEAIALPRLLPDARVLTGEAATKGAVTALSGPRVLHLATHGFFLAGAATPEGEDPLLRSGLAFAGANRREGGDAILTSLEAAGLDLWGTKLVVLSACDTGVGEVRNGDGVYGLRRALVLAGSETQVMSLWPVSDRGTRDLMIGYYRRLAAGEGRGAALRAVRLVMLKDPRRRHPYYWASFIVSGEWATLDGKRP